MDELDLYQYRRLLRQGDTKSLARAFETQWKSLGGPSLRREVKFHPTRRFRFDYAADPLRLKIAIELEGGTWLPEGGGHNRGAHFTKDCVKYNEAARLGWRIFRFTTDMLREDPVSHLVPVRDFIREELNRG